MTPIKFPVVKPVLPNEELFIEYINQIWRKKILTNQGPCVTELENQIKISQNLNYFQLVTNGTIALQLALRSFDLPNNSEIITTPFSYVATLSSILWERYEPVFVDIDPNDFNIDPHKIEEKITPNTGAILAVHVFGNPCDVYRLEKIAKKHNIKIIYDAAHSFGCMLDNKSLLSFGDVSTVSFHATKVFHTIEGGGL